MKSIRQSGWAAVLVLSVATASAQTARPSKQYTIDQFLNTTSIAGASFSADESRILFSSNKTGIWNVYSIPVTGGVDGHNEIDDGFDLRRLLFPEG
jgi:Tol biopolymer transport system component